MPDAYEVSFEDVKWELDGYEITLPVSDFTDFVAQLEVMVIGFSRSDIKMAIWWAVKELVHHMHSGASFDAAVQKIRWPTEVATKPNEIEKEELRQEYSKRTKDDEEITTRVRIRTRLNELIEEFQDRQARLQNKHERSWNPFKRIKIQDVIKPLDVFLLGEARPKLLREFPEDRAVVEDLIKHFTSDDADDSDD